MATLVHQGAHRYIDATGDIPSQQKVVRGMVQKVLRGYLGPRVERAMDGFRR